MVVAFVLRRRPQQLRGLPPRRARLVGIRRVGLQPSPKREVGHRQAVLPRHTQWAILRNGCVASAPVTFESCVTNRLCAP